MRTRRCPSNVKRVSGAAAARAALLTLCCSTAAAAEKPLNISELAGVYKNRFENANIDGSKYRSEDILEIAPISPSASYFRIHLDFYNGHSCPIWGIADTVPSELVYRSAPNRLGETGVLPLKVADSKITFEDEGAVCRKQTCGPRGAYAPGVVFSLSARRKIRYERTLLASAQYAQAMAEYAAMHKSGTAGAE